jgi:hypothetical protein
MFPIKEETWLRSQTNLDHSTLFLSTSAGDDEPCSSCLTKHDSNNVTCSIGRAGFDPTDSTGLVSNRLLSDRFDTKPGTSPG